MHRLEKGGDAVMKRLNVIPLGILAVLVMACSSAPKKEWRKAGMEPNSQAMRDQRARDLADCTTRAGAPTQGVQSTMSYSRAQMADCMHARGWREVSLDE
jgi:hypothetical protein